MTISLSKTSTSTFTASGQTLNYKYVVTNTGTISLTQVSVTDSSDSRRVTATCPLSPSANLAPEASETCTGQYMTTSTDVTNGGVTNEATASGYDVDFGNLFTDNSSLTIPYTGP